MDYLSKLEAAAKAQEQLRTDLLFDEDWKDGVLEGLAELEVLTALGHMHLAYVAMQKALVTHRRALAASPHRQ